jgi:peptidoglycan/xylan/chitin deacetylase (PgdA/CDA1 family)
LAYHKVDKKFELGGTWTTPVQFQKHMDHLKANGITPVTLSRAVELMKSGEGRNKKYVCLTFDDAYEGLYHYAWPILQKHGFPATIFVVTDYVGRENDWDVNWGGRKFGHLGWKQIIEMAKAGIEFGAHTRTHQDLRKLDDEDLRDELAGAKYILEKNLGKIIGTLSYPFGRYDQRVMDAAAECGYISACSLSPKMKNSQINFMALRRSAVYITDIMWNYHNKIFQEGRFFWLQDIWCRLVNFCAGGTIVAQNAIKAFRSLKVNLNDKFSRKP